MEGDKTVAVVMEWSSDVWDMEKGQIPTWVSTCEDGRKVYWKLRPSGGTILIRGVETPIMWVEAVLSSAVLAG